MNVGELGDGGGDDGLVMVLGWRSGPFWGVLLGETEVLGFTFSADIVWWGASDGCGGVCGCGCEIDEY